MRYLYLTFAPLWERFRRGEGALVAINAAIIWFATPGIYTGLISLVLSFIVLALLYSFNDLHDAAEDKRNLKKNQQVVRALLEHRRGFYIYLGAVKLGVLLLTYVLLDARTAAAVISVFAINTVYSLWLKGVPVLDILVVSAWGAAYSAIADPPWRICLVVGIMTSICHIFQILSDREVDEGNRVQTTAVFSIRATTAMLAATCAVLFLVLSADLGPLWSLSAFVPLVLHLGISRYDTGWWLTRIYFGLALVAVLAGFTGHPG
jgi:4-hydroxybenzoate polyprenyltransferase